METEPSGSADLAWPSMSKAKLTGAVRVPFILSKTAKHRGWQKKRTSGPSPSPGTALPSTPLEPIVKQEGSLPRIYTGEI